MPRASMVAHACNFVRAYLLRPGFRWTEGKRGFLRSRPGSKAQGPRRSHATERSHRSRRPRESPPPHRRSARGSRSLRLRGALPGGTRDPGIRAPGRERLGLTRNALGVRRGVDSRGPYPAAAESSRPIPPRRHVPRPGRGRARDPRARRTGRQLVQGAGPRCARAICLLIPPGSAARPRLRGRMLCFRSRPRWRPADPVRSVREPGHDAGRWAPGDRSCHGPALCQVLRPWALNSGGGMDSGPMPPHLPSAFRRPPPASSVCQGQFSSLLSSLPQPYR